MKYLLAAAVFAVSVILSVIDSSFVFLRLSLVLLCCYSLKERTAAVVISGMCGIFCDLYGGSAPFYTFLYLYISIGCVWCRSFLYKVNMGVFYTMSAVALILYGGLVGLPYFLPFALVNSSAAPLFYLCLKGYQQ